MGPRHWECEVLTTGPPGKSLFSYSYWLKCGMGARCKHPLDVCLQRHHNSPQWKGISQTSPEHCEYSNSVCSIHGPSLAKKRAAFSTMFIILNTWPLNIRKLDTWSSYHEWDSSTQRHGMKTWGFYDTTEGKNKSKHEILLTLSLGNDYYVLSPWP